MRICVKRFKSQEWKSAELKNSTVILSIFDKLRFLKRCVTDENYNY